jgi:large subunit ribosomal protein L24
MLLCPVTQKPTRVGIKIMDDGRRVRMSKQSKQAIE